MCEILHTLNASFLECGEHAVGTEMASGGLLGWCDGGRRSPELPALFATANYSTRRRRLSSITRAPCRNVGLLCAYVTATAFYATFIVVQKNDLAAIVTQAHKLPRGRLRLFYRDL